jgi:PAS domain S-box-containing protein
MDEICKKFMCVSDVNRQHADDGAEVNCLLLENLSEVVWQISLDHRYTYINPTCEPFLGYTPEEVVGRSVFDFLTRHSADYVRRIALERQEAARRGERIEKITYEIEHLCKDGRTIWAEVVSNPVYDSEGRLSAFNGIARDVTARKRKETETAILIEIGLLISSTLTIDDIYERFASIIRKLISFDSVTVNLIDVFKNRYRIAYLSGLELPTRITGLDIPLAGTMTAYTMRGRKAMSFEASSVEEITRQYPEITRTLSIQAGFCSNMIIPLISKDAIIGVLHLRSRKRDAYGEVDLRFAEQIGMQIAGAIANAQLYADLQTTEQALRQSEDRYRTLFNDARDGIALSDPETETIVDCNHALARMVDRTREELIGKHQSILHPDHLLVDGRSVTYQEHRAGDPGLVLEDSLLSKGGEIIPVEIGAAKALIGGRTLMFGAFRDITERKKTENALNDALDHFEDRVRRRTLELEETNIALRVLLKKGEEDLKRQAADIIGNVNQLVIPYVQKMQSSLSVDQQRSYGRIIESNLENITCSFIKILSDKRIHLTPKETQIATLIKNGMSSKEIAKTMGVSVGTVLTHRNSIRKKLKLTSRKANLQSHLLSLS